MRLSASLNDADTSRVLWAEGFSVHSEGLLSVRDRVAQLVVDALGVAAVNREEGGQIAPGEDAYLAYLTAEFLMGRPDAGAAQRAYTEFQRAVELEPRYAAAYVGLAQSGRAAGLDLAAREALLDQALAIDPDHAAAHHGKGVIALFSHWDWREAESYLHRAVELEPGNADFHASLSRFFVASRRFAEAQNEIEQTLRLDPISAIAHMDLGWLYLHIRDYDEAAAQCTRTLHITPNFAPARDCLMLAHELLGDTISAAAVAREVLIEWGIAAADLEAWDWLAPVDQLRTYKERHLARLLEGSTPAENDVALALAYAALGNQERAIDHLIRAHEARNGFMVFLAGDPRLDPLRGAPRFQALLETITPSSQTN